MTHFLRLLALIGIVLSTGLGAVHESAGQSSSLTAFYTAPVVSMAPMWIAKEAGFFKKQGLDVKLVFIASGPLGTTAILSGDVDVGIIGGFAPTRAIAGGAKNLVMIGQSKNRMTGAIVGKKEIATVQDLKGRRLGIDRIGSNPDMFTQASLARFNMDPLKDLQYIQLGSIAQGIPALKAGTIDAVSTSTPHDLFAQRLGFKVILDITAMKIPFAATVLLSARNTVERKQADLAKFMRAYAEAVHYFLTNREGTGAKHPLIITEEAGRDPEVVGKLVELAELLGAGVVESRASSYVNFPRTHHLHAGFEPQEFLQEADAAFLLGVVAPWHPASKKLNPGTKVAVLSDNPLRSELPYWGYPVSQILTGEIDSSMKQLLEAVKKRVAKGNGDSARRAEVWRGRYDKRKAEWKEDALGRSRQKPIDTRWVTYELAQIIPSDAIVVEETITHRLSIHRYLDMLKPGTFFAGCIGGLGTGTGTALGVKAANPKRPVLCLIGDGAFNYDPGLAALGVCQEHNLPILIVLFNNYGYHSQKSGVPRFFPDGFAVKKQDFIGISINPSPDYAMIARAFDGYGEKVEDPGEVRAALQRGLKAVAAGQVALIDVRLAKAAESNERPDRAN